MKARFGIMTFTIATMNAMREVQPLQYKFTFDGAEKEADGEPGGQAPLSIKVLSQAERLLTGSV